MDWVLVRGMRVIRISDQPELVYPVHEPKDDKERREAREAQRQEDHSLRRELDDLASFSEAIAPPAAAEASVTTSTEPAPVSAPPAPSPATTPAPNPVAAAQAQAFIEAARVGAPLCEH